MIFYGKPGQGHLKRDESVSEPLLNVWNSFLVKSGVGCLKKTF